MRLFGFFTSTIRRQIIISFVIVTMSLVVFMTVSFYQIVQIRQIAEDVEPLAAQISAQQDLGISLANLDSNLEQYLLTRGQQYSEAAQSEIVKIGAATTIIRANETETSDPDLDEFEQVLAGLETEVQNLVTVDFFALTSNEQNRQIVAVFNKIETVNEVYQDISDETADDLSHSAEEQQDILAWLFAQFLILSVITVVVAVVSTQLISFRVAGPVSHVASA